jgi:hypothetical protein
MLSSVHDQQMASRLRKLITACLRYRHLETVYSYSEAPLPLIRV